MKPGGAPIHILIVENDASISQLLQSVFQNRRWDTSAAYGGEDAIALIETRQPDLVVMDVWMPGIGGIELCHRVAERSSIPVIMLGEGNDGYGRAESLKAGAVDYVGKPFRIADLVAAVRSALGLNNVPLPSAAIGNRSVPTDGSSSP